MREHQTEERDSEVRFQAPSYERSVWARQKLSTWTTPRERLSTSVVYGHETTLWTVQWRWTRWKSWDHPFWKHWRSVSRSGFWAGIARFSNELDRLWFAWQLMKRNLLYTSSTFLLKSYYLTNDHFKSRTNYTWSQHFLWSPTFCGKFYSVGYTENRVLSQLFLWSPTFRGKLYSV